MTERISNARYGGLDDAEVYRVCNLLLEVVATFPGSDDRERRRAIGGLTHKIAVQLARADPNSPLSRALYELAFAIDLYVHFRAPPDEAADNLANVLDQTMRD